jgi:exopolysaccharide production protein ExoZ
MPVNISMEPDRENDGRQPTLDFLRGLAILSVVAFHVSPVFNPGVRIITSVCALGFFGVQLFFLISAITMCYMWDRRLGEGQAPLKFYIRRFFRIAPPFWLAMFGYLLLNGFLPSGWAPDGVGTKQVLTSAFFVNGFWPDTINSVVPGQWSIVDEMMFYAFFPILISCFKTSIRSYLLGASLIYLANLVIVQPIYDVILIDFKHTELLHEFYFFQFFNQAPIFLLGMFLYHFMFGGPHSKGLTVLIVGVSLGWLGLAFLTRAFFSVPASPFLWLAVGLLMVAVVTSFKLKLMWKPINRLGQLSYSIYLIHFGVAEGVEWCFTQVGVEKHSLLGFSIALISILVLCWWLGALSERTVERAASQFGRRLVKAVSAHSDIAAIRKVY